MIKFNECKNIFFRDMLRSKYLIFTPKNILKHFPTAFVPFYYLRKKKSSFNYPLFRVPERYLNNDNEWTIYRGRSWIWCLKPMLRWSRQFITHSYYWQLFVVLNFEGFVEWCLSKNNVDYGWCSNFTKLVPFKFYFLWIQNFKI